jgi:hypothetical protein
MRGSHNTQEDISGRTPCSGCGVMLMLLDVAPCLLQFCYWKDCTSSCINGRRIQRFIVAATIVLAGADNHTESFIACHSGAVVRIFEHELFSIEAE